MKKFKIPLPLKATRNKRNFTTTTKYYANRDENTALNKNKALFELNTEIQTSSHLVNEKSQSPDELFDMLKKNKQESLDNCHSADLSMIEAEKLCVKATNMFTRHKSNLTDQERKEAESNLSLGAVVNSYPNLNNNTEEEKCTFHIDRYLKRLMGAMYRAKSVEGVVSNKDATNNVVSEAENLITELNTLSHNINTLTSNNDKIRTELRNRNISLIEDQLTTFMDMPGDSDSVD